MIKGYDCGAAFVGAKRTEEWLRFVPHARITAYEALGWTLRCDLRDTNHGHFSVLMIWRGDGKPKEPTQGSHGTIKSTDDRGTADGPARE